MWQASEQQSKLTVNLTVECLAASDIILCCPLVGAATDNIDSPKLDQSLWTGCSEEADKLTTCGMMPVQVR